MPLLSGVRKELQMARQKGDGTLFKRGEIWYVAFKINKIRYDKALGTSDKTEAEIRAKHYIETFQALGIRQAKIRTVGIPLYEVWKIFRSKADCSRITFAGYENAWEQFTEFLKKNGVRDTSRLNPALAEEWMESLKHKRVRGRAIGMETVGRLCKGVSRVLKLAGCTNPFKDISKPRCTDKSAREAFSDEELKAIAKIFSNKKIKCYAKSEMEAAHYISLNTGLRREDTCLLKWESIDWQKIILMVIPEKTKRYGRKVFIPITSELEKVLRKQKDANKKSEIGKYVLPVLAERFIRDPSGISQDYTWLLKKAGIVTSVERKDRKAQVIKSFHSLRHTFVSRLAEKGVSPLVIQSMSGHSTMAMTEKYSHIGLDAKRNALSGNNPVYARQQQDPIRLQDKGNSTNEKLEAIKVLLQGRKDDSLASALLALLAST